MQPLNRKAAMFLRLKREFKAELGKYSGDEKKFKKLDIFLGKLKRAITFAAAKNGRVLRRD